MFEMLKYYGFRCSYFILPFMQHPVCINMCICGGRRVGWLWQRTQRTQKRVSSVAVGVQAGAQVTSGQGRDVALSGMLSPGYQPASPSFAQLHSATVNIVPRHPPQISRCRWPVCGQHGACCLLVCICPTVGVATCGRQADTPAEEISHQTKL